MATAWFDYLGLPGILTIWYFLGLSGLVITVLSDLDYQETALFLARNPKKVGWTRLLAAGSIFGSCVQIGLLPLTGPIMWVFAFSHEPTLAVKYLQRRNCLHPILLSLPVWSLLLLWFI